MTKDWYPLRLSTPVAGHVFGDRVIAEHFGRDDLPSGRIAETWEVSDVDGMISEVTNGELAGRSLRDLTRDHPRELVGEDTAEFPLLTKFIDATGPLPVHVHADDATARRREGAAHGKTEAWHVVRAAPGATALCGVRSGVREDQVRQALWREDFDAVLRRVPMRAGETIYVPGGTPHSFGPDTLVYEIEQTSDLQQHAMPWRMQDGAPIDEDTRRHNIDALLAECDPGHQPSPTPGLDLLADDDTARVLLCAGPSFALERHRARPTARLVERFDTAVVLTNLGGAVPVRAGAHREVLEPGRTLLLPATLGEVVLSGPADVLLGHVPDLDRDVHLPLRRAGHAVSAIALLGEL